MFNTTIHKTETNPVTRVIERSISPDKVTEMYDKVREEVEATILRKLRVEDNVMSGVVMECADRYDTRTKHIYLRFTLNGKEYMRKDEVEKSPSKYELYDTLRKFYEDTVATVLMRDTVSKMMPL